MRRFLPIDEVKQGKGYFGFRNSSLSEMALSVLRKLRGRHATRVFTFRGEPIVQVSTRAWRQALRRAGIADFRWHELRHAFATWHRLAGNPTHELQRLGGWKTARWWLATRTWHPTPCRVPPPDSMR
jgi:integrase